MARVKDFVSFPNYGLWFWLNLRKLRFPTVKYFLGMDAGETEYVAEHALFTWLITHLSRDITCTDHVALMH